MKTVQNEEALTTIPGIGISIAEDLRRIGIGKTSDLKGKDPEWLYELSNRDKGCIQDRCLLYAFRCAVYFAGTPEAERDPEKLKWWNWKDVRTPRSRSLPPMA